MKTPLPYLIEGARKAALESPCAKSKRGVVLFDHEDTKRWQPGRTVDWELGTILGIGYNGQPYGFKCSGSEACRRDCAKLCLHAEQRAIMYGLQRAAIHGCDLLHVKVVDGQVVPGGGPSCWQCSRLVVEVGLRGVWLYEEPRCSCPPGEVAFVAIATSLEPHRPDCGLGVPARWRFYTAVDFHRETLRACGIEASA